MGLDLIIPKVIFKVAVPLASSSFSSVLNLVTVGTGFKKLGKLFKYFLSALSFQTSRAPTPQKEYFSTLLSSFCRGLQCCSQYEVSGSALSRPVPPLILDSSYASGCRDRLVFLFIHHLPISMATNTA